MEGSIYTVDDVSDLLGIPRPTLYRYLREYSIPHLRQGGRIRIPEDSFDRIREARDLHKEGLGTETVRRQLREGGGPDTGELDRRLNKLHDTLENLRGDIRAKPATGEVTLSPVLQTILARQSFMLSAMFNLTGMVEDLLLNNGKGRKRPVARAEEGLVHAAPLPAEGRGQISGTVVAEPVAVRETEAPVVTSPVRNLPSGKFGSLGRRRRRGALAVLSALLLGLLLILFLPTLNRDETPAASQDPTPNAAESREPPEKRPAGTGTDEVDREGGSDPANVAPSDAAPQTESTSSGGDAEDTTAAPPDAGGGGIPDVSGRPLEEAARTLSEAGYSVAAIRSVKGPEEYGTVTGTEPSAGTEARPNAPVVLTMSAGPTGASLASASAASTSAASTSAASASAASTSSAGASTGSAASTSASPASTSSASASASPSP